MSVVETVIRTATALNNVYRRILSYDAISDIFACLNERVLDFNKSTARVILIIVSDRNSIIHINHVCY